MVAATGRQAPQLPEPRRLACGIRYVVASNGAIGVDLADRSVLFEELLAPEVAAAIVAHLTTELEGVRFSAVRDYGARHAAEPGYLDLLARPCRAKTVDWRIDTEPSRRWSASRP